MKYSQVIPARFLRRPNRFVAQVELEGRECVVHVKNTGRCKELLQPDAKVYLALGGNPARKTAYDLVAVEKNRPDKAPLLVNLDSQIPNDVAEEWLPRSGLFSPAVVIRREVTYRSARFDFYLEDGPRKIFLEVKGVTLEHDGVASFPDAPTERGVKHLHELVEARQDGYETFLLFVVQMKEMRSLRPNDVTHPAFGDALREAARNGVKILAMDCLVQPDSLVIDQPLPVEL